MFFVRSDMGAEARQRSRPSPNPAEAPSGMMRAMITASDVVANLMSAIETGDLEGVKVCYSPDVVVWANFDGKARELDSSLRVLEWLVTNTTDRRYEIMRRVEIEGGVLQQHVLHATVTATGKSFAMPACLIVSVRGDRINHIDEYLDLSVMTAAFTE